MPPARRYLGTWTLPSGNSVDVYLESTGRLSCEWDEPPSARWSDEDVAHYETVTFPALMQAVARVTRQRILGVQL